MLTGRVLLLEEFDLTALTTEDALTDFGAEEVVTKSSVESALDALKFDNFFAAVIEAQLAEQSCLPVAEALSQARIPFVIATGYAGDNDVTRRFPETPVVEKPYDVESLASALLETLAKRSPA